MRLFLILICIVQINLVYAQSILHGSVVDANSQGLDRVHIIYNNSGCISNSLGQFEISYPDSISKFTISLSRIGYKDKIISIYSGEDDITIVLADSIVALDAILVKNAKYGRVSNYAAQTTPLNTLEINTSPTALGDIIGAQKMLPGVQTNENDGRLIIQGGDVDESKVYVDGLLLHSPYSLSSKNSSVRSRFSPDLFSGTILQSAGYSAQYGDALSGVLCLNTVDFLNPKVDININTTGIESSVLHKQKTSSFRLNASYMNLQPYGMIFKDDYDWEKYFNQSSVNWFSIHKAGNGILKVNFTYNNASVAYNISSIDDILYHQNLSEHNVFGSLVYNSKLSNYWDLYIGANYGFNDFKGNDVIVENDEVNDKESNSHIKIKADYRCHKISNSIGLENLLTNFDENYINDNQYRLSYLNSNISIFDELSIFLNDKWSANTSVRCEYSTYLKKVVFAPRLFLGFRINQNNSLSLSTGKYDQLPNKNQLKYSKEIGFRKSYNTTLTYNYVEEKSKLQFDLFAKRYESLVTYSRNLSSLENSGSGYSYGISAFWKYNIQRLEWWLTASHIDSKILKENWPDRITPSYLAKNRVSVTSKYWIASLKSMVGASFFIDDGATFYNKEFSMTQKSPFRHQLDLSWSYLPAPGVIIHFGCKNVYGRKNVYGYEFSSVDQICQAVSTSNKQFFYIGAFITLSKTNKNQLHTL